VFDKRRYLHLKLKKKIEEKHDDYESNNQTVNITYGFYDYEDD
jgi:hypothetical protein